MNAIIKNIMNYFYSMVNQKEKRTAGIQKYITVWFYFTLY